MHFRQHVPNFCEGVERYEFDFDTTEQLLAHPRIQEFQRTNYTGSGPFHRYSLVPHGDETVLMAEYDGGKHGWAIGYIDDASGVDLPRWTSPSKA